MNLSKATNKQLWNIVQDDKDCPSHLMKSVVHELLTRYYFDYLIHHLIRKMFPYLKEVLYALNMEKEELIQIGRNAVYIASTQFESSKQTFKGFAYMNIKSEYGHILDKYNSKKRAHYKAYDSLEKELGDEFTLGDTIQAYQNTEKYVINKIYWEEIYNRLNEKEGSILQLFLKGYSFNEIANGYVPGIKSPSIIHRHFHRAIKKINPNAPKINLRNIGIVTHSKREVTA